MSKFFKTLLIILSGIFILSGCEQRVALNKPISQGRGIIPIADSSAENDSTHTKPQEETTKPSTEESSQENAPEPEASQVPNETTEQTLEQATEQSSETNETTEESPEENASAKEEDSPPPGEEESTPTIAITKEENAETDGIVKIKVDIPEVDGYPEVAYGSPYTKSGVFSSEKLSWYFNRNKDHVPPTATGKFDIRQLDGYYLGDTSKKYAYLTFDEGYENGYTEKILDVLKDKQVKATFFVTKPYITQNPDLIKRIVEEGHLVGNHSDKHKSFPEMTDDEIINDIKECEKAYEELMGQPMPKFFRPPMGEYSARSMAATMAAGYKSIFWSFAYKDWEVDNQPSKTSAYTTIMNDLHNGQIILLHAVSKANTEVLADVIDSYFENGYEFLSLYDLPN